MKLKAKPKKFEKNYEVYKYQLDFVFGKNYC
jgi:hypothetical protein